MKNPEAHCRCLKQQFLSRINQLDNGCWLAKEDRRSFYVNGEKTSFRQAAWLIWTNEKAPIHLRTSCKQPWCCNPYHIMRDGLR